MFRTRTRLLECALGFATCVVFIEAACLSEVSVVNSRTCFPSHTSGDTGTEARGDTLVIGVANWPKDVVLSWQCNVPPLRHKLQNRKQETNPSFATWGPCTGKGTEFGKKQTLASLLERISAKLYSLMDRRMKELSTLYRAQRPSYLELKMLQ